MDGELALRLDSIEAPLNFLIPMAEKPYSYAYEPPPGKPQRNGVYAETTVQIRNGRKLADVLSLDHEGFALVRRPTKVADLYDHDAIRSVYLGEVERIVRDVTGAARVIAFDYNLRNAARAQNAVGGIKEPVGRVHNDFTAKSAPERARTELASRGESDAEIDRLLKRRFALVNLWRPIVPVEDWPLAAADASSIAPEDLVATDLIYADRVGETYAVTHNPAQRWFYFPRMQRDEALLLKVYDSDAGLAQYSAHTAFHDPHAAVDARPRESIEVRTLVLFA